MFDFYWIAIFTRCIGKSVQLTEFAPQYEEAWSCWPIPAQTACSLPPSTGCCSWI